MADVFVGRERELGTLAAFLERALSGRAQVVFIAGEAGAGKSSLVGEFVRRVEEANCDLVAATGECNAQTGAGESKGATVDGRNRLPDLCLLAAGH